ncbi:MAG TPA: hypothetical protein VNP95_07480 [Thermomicrobiales bacterium]|nr:hypothetical protein [Thermomicrobiales bacterium]
MRWDAAVIDGFASITRAASPVFAPADPAAPSNHPHPLRHFLYGHPLMVKLIDPPTRA